MAERTSLSKRTRFEVFKRDGFRCVYCGSTPNDGPLHVDHVDPVAEGGSDDLTNLVTACASCNLGKSDVPLSRRAPALDPAAAAEQAEQIQAWVAAQRSVINAKRDSEQEMVNLWCETFGTKECDPEVPGRLLRLLNEWSLAEICEALQICASNGRLWRDVARLRYMYGVLRNWRERREVARSAATLAASEAAGEWPPKCRTCGSPKRPSAPCPRCGEVGNA
jgi:hypothetical protein